MFASHFLTEEEFTASKAIVNRLSSKVPFLQKKTPSKPVKVERSVFKANTETAKAATKASRKENPESEKKSKKKKKRKHVPESPSSCEDEVS